MKAFIEEYGTTCVVVVVIVALLSIVTILKDDFGEYYSDILDSFVEEIEESKTSDNDGS